MTEIAATSAVPGNPRNVTFDLIRGLCIVYIVGYWHLLGYTSAFPNYSRPPAPLPTVVVLGLFVMMSGVLAGGKNIKPNWAETWGFYRARLLKIYPPYILAIVLFKVLELSTVGILLKGVLLISMFSVPAPPTLWFVAMLFCYYFVTPFLCFARGRGYLYLSICVLVAAPIYIYHRAASAVDLRILIYFPAYAMGVFLAAHKEQLRRINLILLTALLTLSIFICFQDLAAAEESLYSTSLALFGPLAILSALSRKPFRHGHTLIGVVSYSGYFMYLFHRPIFEIVRRLYFPSDPWAQLAFLLSVCLPLIISISWLAQSAYDCLIARLRIGRPSVLPINGV